MCILLSLLYPAFPLSLLLFHPVLSCHYCQDEMLASALESSMVMPNMLVMDVPKLVALFTATSATAVPRPPPSYSPSLSPSGFAAGADDAGDAASAAATATAAAAAATAGAYTSPPYASAASELNDAVHAAAEAAHSTTTPTASAAFLVVDAEGGGEGRGKGGMANGKREGKESERGASPLRGTGGDEQPRRQGDSETSSGGKNIGVVDKHINNNKTNDHNNEGSSNRNSFNKTSSPHGDKMTSGGGSRHGGGAQAGLAPVPSSASSASSSARSPARSPAPVPVIPELNSTVLQVQADRPVGFVEVELIRAQQLQVREGGVRAVVRAVG